jgi:hypothetical protein
MLINRKITSNGGITQGEKNKVQQEKNRHDQAVVQNMRLLAYGDEPPLSVRVIVLGYGDLVKA